MAHSRLSLMMGVGLLLLTGVAMPAAAQPAVYRPGAGATTPRPGNGPPIHGRYQGGRFAPGVFSKQQFNPDGRLRAPRNIFKPDATIPVAEYNPDVPTLARGPQSVRLVEKPSGYRFVQTGRGPEPDPLAPIDPDVLASQDNPAIVNAITARERARGAEARRDPICRPGELQNDKGFVDGAAPDGIMLNSEGVDPFIADGNKSVAAARPLVDPEPVLSIPDAAAKRLRDAKPDEAIVTLRSYVGSNPADVGAARTLALALLDARRTVEGIELMGKAYSQSPALASAPIPADAVGQPQELRELVVRVVSQAHKSNTPAAWLTAAVLMQAEGRRDPALKMVDRADAVALKADVSSSIRSALRR